MKNVFKVLGILALVAMIGFSFVACDDESTDDNGGGGGDGGGGVELPTLYQNTTWVNSSPEDYYNEYTKISFKVTSATLFRDDGAITDNTGKNFSISEVGPNNYYTNELGTNVLQIILKEIKPPPPPVAPGEPQSESPTIQIYVFVKEDGSGIDVKSYGTGSYNETKWTKQP